MILVAGWGLSILTADGLGSGECILLVEFRGRSDVSPIVCPTKEQLGAAGLKMTVDLQDQAGSRIFAIVTALLVKRGSLEAPTSDQNLREAGLTSLDLVNLMLAIEGEFDIFIPDEKMSPQNFTSIDAILALISSLAKAA